jgi:hypothetical protein
MRKCLIPLLLLVVWIGSPGIAALAAWGVVASGVGRVSALTLSAGSAPSTSVSGRTVTLSWTASTEPNGASATDYIVKRYDSGGASQQVIYSGSCASSVAGTTCSESGVPPGTWRYSVTPRYQGWSGPASPLTAVSVASPGLNFSQSVVKSPSTLTGSLTNFIDSETVIFHLDAVTGAVLSGTVNGTATPAAVPAGGSAPVTVTVPAGTTQGSHIVYAVASASGDSAGGAVTVDNTPPPSPTLTGSPSSFANSAGATFSFTDAEGGVTFQCRVDTGSFSTCTSPKSYNGLSEGSHTFQVKALDAATNASTTTSYTWTVDTVAPGASVTFPATGNTYSTSIYNPGCSTATTGDICGTTLDTGGSGVTRVQVSIQRGSGNYWNGSGFSSATEVLFDATGTASWSYPFAAGNFSLDGAYTVRAKATDAAGNVTTATSTFTIDNTGPAGADVQTTNYGATVGKPEPSDVVSFTYSEAIKPASILSGWTGSSTNVVARVTNGGAGNDTVTVWNSTNTAQLPLGSLDLGAKDYVTTNITFGATGTASTMVQSGATITVTLGTASASPGTAAASGTMSWTPSASATDAVGNPCSTTATSESTPPSDKEF